MEKKYVIFYYDTEEGFPILDSQTLRSVCDVLESFFKDKNIDCLLLPKDISHSNEKTREELKSFLISYLNKILTSERGEDI